MKKSIYLLMMFFGLALTGCEPMEDIHEQVDASIGEPNVQGAVEIRLTEDDYTTDIEDGGLGLDFPNFNSVEDAKALIPQYLSTNYPAWGKGSLALVTFDVYSPMVVKEQTVTAAGYEAAGRDVNYFTAFWQIEDYLEYQFPDVKEGTFVELTYRFKADEKSYELGEDDYDVIGDELDDEYPKPAANAAQYNTFEIREDEDTFWSMDMIIEAVGVAIDEEFGNVPGQVYNVTYETFAGSGNYETEEIAVVYWQNKYILAGAVNYQLTWQDYDYIETQLEAQYPDAAANAGRFSSFDVTGGDNNWTMEMILEAINATLKKNFPAAEEGAEFVVTYKVFLGAGTELRTVNLVLENGVYVVNDAEPVVYTVEETKAYAFVNNEWVVPFTLEDEDYKAMGQSFPNFDDEEEAIFKLETFLELEFPYAEEGDIIPVAYTFTFFEDGKRKFETRYANFRFEDGEFHFITDVVQETIQFGHNGTEWEPDNTIEYTLTAADYVLIEEQLSGKYPDPTDNAGYFGSFNRIKGSSDYWSDEMLLEAMIVVLNDIAPNPEEGQKYVLYFMIYSGSESIESLSFIYLDGEWVLNE